jgi:hypothetical protein
MALALLDTDEEPVVVDQSIFRRGRSPVVEEVFDVRSAVKRLLDAIEPVEPPAVASPLRPAIDR